MSKVSEALYEEFLERQLDLELCQVHELEVNDYKKEIDELWIKDWEIK